MISVTNFHSQQCDVKAFVNIVFEFFGWFGVARHLQLFKHSFVYLIISYMMSFFTTDTVDIYFSQ